MIENPSAQDEIELANRLRSNIMHVNPRVLNPTLLNPSGKREKLKRPLVPCVDCQDLGASALHFEGEESVPCSDIESSLSAQIGWQIEQPQAASKAALVSSPLGDDPKAQIDRRTPMRSKTLQLFKDLGFRQFGLLVHTTHPPEVDDSERRRPGTWRPSGPSFTASRASVSAVRPHSAKGG